MTYTLKLNEQQLSVLAQALGEMPYKFAAPLMASINAQVHVQEAARQEEAQPASTEKEELSKGSPAQTESPQA